MWNCWFRVSGGSASLGSLGIRTLANFTDRFGVMTIDVADTRKGVRVFVLFHDHFGRGVERDFIAAWNADTYLNQFGIIQDGQPVFDRQATPDIPGLPDGAVFEVDQIAKILCVAPRMVRRWTDSGKLKTIDDPHPGHLRVKRSDLVAFMKSTGVLPATFPASTAKAS